jgi:putative PEP-CTERM system histidine kinase
VTPSTFATSTAWSYGLALTGYVAFSVRVAFASRANSRARLLLGALAATAVWAAFCLSLGVSPTPLGLLGMAVFDAVRYGLWFLFMAHLLVRSGDASVPSTPAKQIVYVVVAAALILAVLLSDPLPFIGFFGASGPRIVFLLWLCLSVFALIVVEQVVRRVEPQMRWAIRPLALGLGGVFGFELLLYADATLFSHIDADIWVARGVANVIVIPFLAIATARNTGWTVDLHLSRQAVFHSTALLLSGGFLLAIAVAGYFIRFFGGGWGRALQIELLFASTLLVLVVATSGRFRSRLKVFVSKHFFSYRYDYRQEWLRFTQTLSTQTGVQGLQERTVMALADLVESPAGGLWLKDELRGFVPAARWNMPRNDAIERADGALAAFLARTGWIVVVADLRAGSREYADLPFPAWLDDIASSWVIVPLGSGTDLQGFVVLSRPRTDIELDWEVRDLLKTASRQAASYLGQIRATEALIEARKFDAFNRMSAFVVHDLKNLVAQLSLMLKNAERHRNNPAFQSDMLATVDHVVNRMNGLMLQLRAARDPVERAHHLDVSIVLRRVCASKADTRIALQFNAAGPVMTVGHEERLEHVIGHLVQNAIDATPAHGRIDVRLEHDSEVATVIVSDEGVGMTEEFVRERLFKPFQTTKTAGMGIGVYESSQYVAGLGGDIIVESEPNRGTTVRVRLPVANVMQAETGTVTEEAT